MNVHIEKTESLTNELTGELLSLTKEVTDINTIPVEPNYLKLYIEDLGLLKKLSGSEINILLYVAAQADYSGEVHLPLLVKGRVAESVGVKVQAVNNAIVKLSAKGLIKRIGTSVYILNPDLFAKGKWRDIREQRKAFQSITTYTPDGKKQTETRIIEEVATPVQIASLKNLETKKMTADDWAAYESKATSPTANDDNISKLKVIQ